MALLWGSVSTAADDRPAAEGEPGSAEVVSQDGVMDDVLVGPASEGLPQATPPAGPVPEAPVPEAPVSEVTDPEATVPAALARNATPEQISTWLDAVVLLITGPAYCSGVLIDDRGTVATAYHCVASGLRPRVITRDNQEGKGRIIATRPREDIALVSVPALANRGTFLDIHDDQPQQGDRVYGMGHPFAPAAERSEAMEGMLLWSVTEGIVSAVGPRLIQTDAALNPGNSGGPVVDAQGRIVGITSRKLGGDNVAFLSSAQQLRELIADPGKPFFLGGHWQVGLSLLQGTTAAMSTSWMLTSHVVLRERVVLGGGVNLSSPARSTSLETGFAEFARIEAGGSLRQRLGTGGWSTTLDAGGGAVVLGGYTSSFDATEGRWDVQVLADRARPYISGRVGLASLGLRVMALPPMFDNEGWGGFIGLDLDTPGALVTF